jgi:membrane-bound lytic murein transglycosylase MltF
MVDQYFASEPMTDTNKLLFAFAAYNAGPGRVQVLRVEAAQKELDPNVWVDNVEMIAARVGMEASITSRISTNITAFTNW